MYFMFSFNALTGAKDRLLDFPCTIKYYNTKTSCKMQKILFKLMEKLKYYKRKDPVLFKEKKYVTLFRLVKFT